MSEVLTAPTICDYRRPQEKRETLRYLTALKVTLQYCTAVPLALLDTIKMQYTNNIAQSSGISPEFTQATLAQNLKTHFQYCLSIHRGMTHEEAHQVIASSIRARIAILEQEEQKELAASPIMPITYEDTKNHGALRAKIITAMTGDKMMQLLTNNPTQLDGMRTTLISTMEELGLDVEQDITEVTPSKQLTPYTYINTSAELGEINHEIAQIYGHYVDQRFAIAEKSVGALYKTFKEIQSSRILTMSEKRQFVIGIMHNLGAPVEDIRKLLSATREGRRHGINSIDNTPLLVGICRTQAALEVIRPEIAELFADTVIDIIGTTKAEKEHLMVFLQNEGVKLATTVSSSFLGEKTLKKTRIFWRIMGIPEPDVDPLKFLEFWEKRLRDLIWLHSFALGEAGILCALTEMSFVDAWSVTRSLVWLKQLSAIFPNLYHFSLDKKFCQEGFASDWPIIGSFLQSIAKILPEGLGVGCEPMKFSRYKRVPGYLVTLVSGGPTFHSKGKHYVNIHNSEALDENTIISKEVWVFNPISKKLERQSQTIKYDRISTQIGTSLTENYYSPGLFNLFARISAKANDQVGKQRWILQPWKWNMHGSQFARGQGPNKRELWRLGLTKLVYFWLPEIRLYKRPEEQGVETRGTEGTPNPTYDEVERALWGSHFLSNLWDNIMADLGIYLNLFVIQALGLDSAIEGIERITDIHGIQQILYPINQAAETLTDPKVVETFEILNTSIQNLLGRVINWLSDRSGGTSGTPVEAPSPLNGLRRTEIVRTGTLGKFLENNYGWAVHVGPDNTLIPNPEVEIYKSGPDLIITHLPTETITIPRFYQ